MTKKPIPSFPGYIAREDGAIENEATGRIIRGRKGRNGYIEACIAPRRGESKTVLLHRLIAEAFLPAKEGKNEVNHISGDKADNRPSNLEWASREDNLRHAYEHGLREDDVSPRKVTATDIDTGDKTTYPSIYRAARALGISQGNICLCCQGKRQSASGYRWDYE